MGSTISGEDMCWPDRLSQFAHDMLPGPITKQGEIMQSKSRALAVVATALGALAIPAVATAHTKVVFAGQPPLTGKIAAKIVPKGFGARFNPDFNAFLLNRVTINAGDTVSFRIEGFHTIDLPAKGGQPLGLLLPGAAVTGINDAAGNPFWFNGKVPSLGINPALFAPSGSHKFDGSAATDSGLPLGNGKPKPFNVQFTKPGTYKFFCNVHAGMFGVVVVKPRGAKIPTAKQDAATLVRQVTSDVNTAKAISKPKLPKNTVSVGSSGPGGVELFTMFPNRMTVKPGTTVTFMMSRDSREDHTASFGPQPYLNTLANQFAGPVFPPAGAYPSDPVQPLVLSPTSHGNGFANTGVMDRVSASPLPPSGRITFTTAGTYHYQCLIHVFMRGTIVVK
jgi:plastocyanin